MGAEARQEKLQDRDAAQCLRLQWCLPQLPQATMQQCGPWPSCAGSQLALSGLRWFASLQGTQWQGMVNSGTSTASENLALCAGGQGKSGWERDACGAPWEGWTSAEGLWALGAHCACVTLPQCAPPANTFPTTAAPTSQPAWLPKIACSRVGSLHPRVLAVSMAGTSLAVALTSISVPLSATFLVFGVCTDQGLGPKLWCWCQSGHWGCIVTDLHQYQAPARLPLVFFSFSVKLKLTAAGAKSEVLSAIEV